jgi:phospholipid/cholesterol/gamma-HCH transport system permease protein
MTQTAEIQPTLKHDDQSGTLHACGDWVLDHARALHLLIDNLSSSISTATTINTEKITRLDTAGALLLLRLLQRLKNDTAIENIQGLRETDALFLRLITSRRAPEKIISAPHFEFRQMLERVGAAVWGFIVDAREFVGFVGLVVVTGLQVILRRRQLRTTSTVFHMEQVGLDAVPIIALLTFLIGAVVAFVGATALRDFGAELFTVELVSISFLREFGVLLTAILLAGRSGSAFTAQIGSMKSREELDAIQVLGFDAIELLVIPRLLALVIMLPLLSFIAMIMGCLGGGVVGVFALDITPGMFISRLYEMTDISHFWVGMVKAPIFAFLIAIVGCLQGLKVEGSAESVGRHTTAAVVQSIFLVIVVDALFAIFFMELDI